MLALTMAASCNSAPPITPAPTVALGRPAESFTPTPTPRPRPSPTPTRSVEQITLALSSSKFLDALHSAQGVQCKDCHAGMPPPVAPETQVCLRCHGGTYGAVADRLEGVAINPHRSHIGQVPCTWCHNVHMPFDYYCTQCHKDIKNSRFE